MITLLATLGFCVGSALLPFLNAEVYVLAVGALAGPPDPWLLAGSAAVGQMIGKTVIYCAGRGGLRLPRVLRRDHRPGRWSARLERWRTRAEDRPITAAALVLVSAFTGLPPFASVSLLAGVVRHPIWLFEALGLLGRYGRFASLLCIPAVWHCIGHT